jgi:hypothetical protein
MAATVTKLYSVTWIPRTAGSFEYLSTPEPARFFQSTFGFHETRLRKQFCILFAIALLCLVFPRGAIAQDANIINVGITARNYQFLDRYQFQHYTTANNGVLITGGFTTTATATRYVPEVRTKTVPYTVVVVINGKRQFETRYREVRYIVYVPVKETSELELPEVKGKWYSLSHRTHSVWLVCSARPTGVVFGVGFRQGQQIDGCIIYLLASRRLTGIYEVSPLLAP